MCADDGGVQAVEKLVFAMLDKVEKTIKRDEDREEKQRYEHSDCGGVVGLS